MQLHCCSNLLNTGFCCIAHISFRKLSAIGSKITVQLSMKYVAFLCITHYTMSINAVIILIFNHKIDLIEHKYINF